MTGITRTGMNASRDTRWHQRFENLERAFRLLQEAAGRQSLSDLEAEGMVQRFEYTFELAWKTLKDFLELQGFSVAYPREVIKTAFQVGLISMGDAYHLSSGTHGAGGSIESRTRLMMWIAR